MKKLLIANRGEIAVRILRAASELNIQTVAVFSEDEENALHCRRADAIQALKGKGAAAYLDAGQILDVARKQGCDAIHPGYGFLSENAEFAGHCQDQGLVFVGPPADTLAILGNKAKTREMAQECGVPIPLGLPGPVSLEQAQDFFLFLDPGSKLVIKAVHGGGGRGLRVVDTEDALAHAFERCRSEARQAFGSPDVYVEQYLPETRHIEVQIAADRQGNVIHLWERECSLQRHHQKLIEIAPCPSLSQSLRERICADALTLARAVNYENLGTFEFVVDRNLEIDTAAYAFIEANPRLQVEHTVTEEIMDIDLVKLQLQLAGGLPLDGPDSPWAAAPSPRGFAIQVRINMETMDKEGHVLPASGEITTFEIPSGRGVRVDTCGHAGFRPNPHFDSLLAKLVGHCTAPRFEDAVVRTARALEEFIVQGIPTNIAFLRNLLRHPAVSENQIWTGFVEAHLGELIPMEQAVTGGFMYSIPRDAGVVTATLQGCVVDILVAEEETVINGQPLLVLSAMKMEHEIRSGAAGKITRIAISKDDIVTPGQPLIHMEVQDATGTVAADSAATDIDRIRPDLQQARERHGSLLDAARPKAVEKRRAKGRRTARENVADLCDGDTFVEYGGLAVAARRRTQSLETLIQQTPADGLVAGVGCVNKDLFGEEKARCVVMAYDYTVLAGTQGFINHFKKDRLFELARRWRIPLVIFTEGGGGRPGDTDVNTVAGLDLMAFHLYAKLSGLVPLVAVNAGLCFAGNAALLGCSDVVIATRDSSIGMGGPAMIEGGGLGVVRPEAVGPTAFQAPNGVVDILVADEAEAIQAAKTYLSYFQGPLDDWECADQRLLRSAVPENRLRVYDIRKVVETLADSGSVLELRRDFGLGMVTALIRIEGRPMGLIANNPMHLSGAIDSDAADKAARFMQLCDAFDLPILFLCDTPGMMVGPEAEKEALVRHCSRLFVTGANLSVPFFTIVLRKAYGLGALTMAGGSSKVPVFFVAWPTGEFGAMGFEGAVKLGFRKELAAVEDPEARRQMFESMVQIAYEHGKALNAASYFEIDDVIDPAASRHWIMRSLRSLGPAQPRTGKKRPYVDSW